MRPLILPALLATAACEPAKVPSPQDTGHAPDTSAGGGSGGGAADSETGASSDDSAADTGEAAAADPMVHACNSLGPDAEICCLMMSVESGQSYIAAYDPAVGGRGARFVEMTMDGSPAQRVDPDFQPRDVASLGREGPNLFACPYQGEVYTVDLRTGESARLPEISCTSIATWQGDDPYAGGLLVVDAGTAMTSYYADFASLADGLPDDYLGYATSTNYRITTYEDQLIGAVHSTTEVSRQQLPALDDLGALTLDGFDTWVWGMSVVDGVLYLIDDGRQDGEPMWQTRLLGFDLATGAQLSKVYIDDTDVKGLHCEAR